MKIIVRGLHVMDCAEHLLNSLGLDIEFIDKHFAFRSPLSEMESKLIEKNIIIDLPENISVRCIYLPDRQFEARKAMLDALLPGIDHQRFEHESTAQFSSAIQPFELLLFHGDDERRMAKAIRDVSPLLHSKVKLAFMSESSPPARAVLLHAGFDAVFDGRSDIVEIASRIAAILARIRLRKARESENSPDIDWDAVNQNTTARLTRREAEYFSVLYRSLGNKVPFRQLAESRLTQHRSRSQRALSVAMSKLRRKIGSHLEIVSTYDGGYVLRSRERP